MYRRPRRAAARFLDLLPFPGSCLMHLGDGVGSLLFLANTTLCTLALEGADLGFCCFELPFSLFGPSFGTLK